MNTREMVDGFMEGFKVISGALPKPLRKKVITGLSEFAAARALWEKLTPAQRAEWLGKAAGGGVDALSRPVLYVSVIELLERVELEEEK